MLNTAGTYKDSVFCGIIGMNWSPTLYVYSQQMNIILSCCSRYEIVFILLNEYELDPAHHKHLISRTSV